MKAGSIKELSIASLRTEMLLDELYEFFASQCLVSRLVCETLEAIAKNLSAGKVGAAEASAAACAAANAPALRAASLADAMNGLTFVKQMYAEWNSELPAEDIELGVYITVSDWYKEPEDGLARPEPKNGKITHKHLTRLLKYHQTRKNRIVSEYCLHKAAKMAETVAIKNLIDQVNESTIEQSSVAKWFDNYQPSTGNDPLLLAQKASSAISDKEIHSITSTVQSNLKQFELDTIKTFVFK